VQSFARQKTVSYLEGKLKTKVEIKKISFDFPKLLVLEDVYFEDQKRDTLIAGDTLKVDISLFKLLHNEIEINAIDLRGITANIQRAPGSVYNFDYIIKAFVKPQIVDTTASTLKFSIHKINLDRIRTSFRDAVTSSDVSLYVGHFDTEIKQFDAHKMKFAIPDIKLSGVNARIIQNKPAAKPETYAKDSTDAAQPVNMDLKLGTISLDKVKIYYQNDISSIKADINLDKANVESDNIDMKNQHIALKKLDLHDSKILFQLGKTQQAKIVAKESAKEIKVQAQNWQVSVNDITLQNNDILFDNFNMPVLKRGMDYGHLDIKGLDFKGRFIYAADSISGKITSGKFRDKSGFELKDLRADVLYGPNRVNLDNLYLQTSHTLIKNQIHLSYSSFADITKNIGDLGIEANLNNSKLGLRDVLTFMPALASTDPFKSNPNASFNINGRISGKVNNLNLTNLQISGLTNTRINASGRITGLPDLKKAYYNIALKEFNSSSKDLNVLVSKGTIPANIRLPESFNLSGSFKGTGTNFNTNLSLNSSYGDAKAVGSIKGESFDGDIHLDNFQVGHLIKQDSMIGRVTGSAKVNGAGFDPKKMHANYSATVQSAELKGYTYHNVVAEGSIANQDITSVASINDPNVKLNLDIKANITNTYPSVDFTLNVDSANLQALKLYKDPLLFRGKIIGNLPSTDPDKLIGKVDASNLVIATGGKRYQIDSVHVLASATGDQRNLSLRSEVLTANLTGKYTLTEVGNALINEGNKYFKIGDGKTLPVHNAQDFSFVIHAVNRPILQQFLPGLTQMETADISGNFNSTTGTLVLKGTVPQLTYMGYSFSNLRLNANTDANALNYSVNSDQAGSSTIKINQTALTGKAQNNLLNVNLNVKDPAGKDQYRVAGLFSVLPDQYQFKFDQNGLMLNYESWTVSAYICSFLSLKCFPTGYLPD